MDSNQNVIVLGGGIVGICTALYLAESGLRVRLIDRHEPGQGASSGNAGVISPWSIIPQSTPGLWKQVPGWLIKKDGPVAIRAAYLPKLLPWAVRFFNNGQFNKVVTVVDAMEALNRNNVKHFRDLLKNTQSGHLIRDSYYVHAFRRANEACLDSFDYMLRRDKGAEIERINRKELQQLEPALSREFNSAIIIKGQARALSPNSLARALLAKFIDLGGVVIQDQIDHISPHPTGWWTVRGQHSPYQCTRLIVAMGAWSKNLLKPLGIRVPLEAERGYHIEFQQTDIELNNSVMDMDLKMVASSMQQGIRVAGTAEFAGLDAPANTRRAAGLISAAKKMLPGVADLPVSHWMGSRPSTPDSLPCLGQIPDHDGLYAAFGHSHYGLMMAPRTGQVIRDLILGIDPGIDLQPYQINRF
ncbi:NAD(P)/FAD-dependent oxidoreductase [Arenicellales bacterium nBUS_48]